MRCRRPKAAGEWCSIVLAISATLLLATDSSAEPLSGKQIYKRHCASCHGLDGQGTKKHADPLAGDRTLAGLIKYIDREMPEETPEKCTGPDAERVARYVFDAFYSPIAQARHSKARIELARLTVRQYEHTVADLLRSFSGQTKWDTERGIQAEYFNNRYGPGSDAIMSRRENGISFDGAIDDVEWLKNDEYAVRWRGGLLAPVTGDYQFTLVAKSGARVYINDDRVPRIDAWVRSGAETRQSVTMRLLGGRVYPILVEMQKSKKDQSASCHLRWKPPHRAEEAIPHRHFTPHRQPETFVLTTKFPPDDMSRGYERGNLISKEWDAATTEAALEIAAHIESRLERLAGYKDASPENLKRLRSFCEKFVERALRRPLSDEQKSFYLDRQFANTKDPILAVKHIVLLVLKSPRFLYHGLDAAEHEQYEIASRLSYAIWDSLPDQKLFAAAQRGQLNTHAQLSTHV